MNNESANEKLGLPRDEMKKIIIAFDVDGTLLNNEKCSPECEPGGLHKGHTDEPNQRIVDMMCTLSTFKNVRIIVWSGGGKEYAEMQCRKLQVDTFVDEFMSKTTAYFAGFKPDIAIDDIQDTALGVINLIVREK